MAITQRVLSSQELTDLVVIMRAALMGLDQAKAIDPSANTHLRQLPDPLWRDPAFQDFVQAAFLRTASLVTTDPTLRVVRFFDLPALIAYAKVQQIAGHLAADGQLVGILGREPDLLRWAKGSKSLAERGAGRAAFAGAVAAAGIGAFVLARAAFAMRG